MSMHYYSMERTRKLATSIIINLLILLVIQISGVMLLIALYDLPLNISEWFIPITIFVHLAVCLILYFRVDLFYTIADKRPLSSVGLTNTLSLFRISATPTLALLLLNVMYTELRLPFIILLGGVFLTDFIDGKLSRYLHLDTSVGRHIDSWSDYLVVLTITSILYHRGLFSGWFLVATYIRFSLPVISTFFLFFFANEPIYYRSWIGQASIFAIMTFITIALALTLFPMNFYPDAIISILSLIALLGFILPSIAHWIVDVVATIQRSLSASPSADSKKQ